MYLYTQFGVKITFLDMEGGWLIYQVHWFSWIEILEGVFVDRFGMSRILNEKGVHPIRRVDYYSGTCPAHAVDLTHYPEESLGGNVLDEMTHVYPADAVVLQGDGFILDVTDNVHAGQGSDIQADVAFPFVRSASDIETYWPIPFDAHLALC